MAIARYCAKLANLEGSGADWSTSEMMMEESCDLFDLFTAAKYRHASPDSEEAWDKCVKEDFPKHLIMLEPKVTATGFFGTRMCAGDIAICGAINLALDNGLDLTVFPKLAAMYSSICTGKGVLASYIANSPAPYFKRPAQKPVLIYWGIKARNHLSLMVLNAGKVDFTWQQDPGDFKSYAPFGQLPVLKVKHVL
jgi:glutathione S-transferase